ncbi:MAG: hypothetical protein LC800_05205 [Acidobacteria bacterium]|nr:hypothetical protein [Acidobacteriota bacterium]
MIKIARALALLTLCLALPAAAARAQREEPRFDFYARGPYRDGVPRPQVLTKFDVGDFHTNYATMERWLERVAAAAADRVRVYDIGETNERRMQHVVAITAPENLRRIDEIKANVRRLADPRSTSPGEAGRIAANTPVVVWLAYTIHGNESASFEAMMQVVYQLAASDEPATLDALKNTLVLVNVCENPDGHERFVTWYNSVATGNPDPLAAEHREPWSVFGRYNRYRFDLNRDNMIASQVETRNMQRAYLEWNPQVSVDHHGQTSQFFFPPAALPVNPNLPPQQTTRWLAEFGRANAAQFDTRHWDYYVRDVFDLFYPGYWDTWPALNGATAMTYETDGGGFKGLRWRRDDDTIVTLRSAIAKHYVASLSTVEVAARNRAARLADFYEFRRTGMEEARTGRAKRFVILPGRDPGRAAEIADALAHAGVEVGATTAPFRSSGAHNFMTPAAPAAAREFPAGAYVVDLAQPQKRLAKALLEPETEIDREFVREQLARRARNLRRGAGSEKEGYQFYDVTAWSLPLAFGVEAYWTEDAPPVQADRVQLGTSGSLFGRTFQPDAGGDARRAILPPLGGMSARASVAYLIPYERNGAASLVYRLLKEDFKLAVATRPLTAAGRVWPRGTVVARLSRNPDAIHERIGALAREAGVDVFAVNSGFAETGDTVVGSETVVSIRRPKIIVVADDPVSQTSYGWLWWTLDRHGVDFTPMTLANLRRTNLDQYNVIIMPDGSAGGYFGSLGKPGVDNLRAWVQRGGTLVAIKGAAVFAALKDVNLTSSRLVGTDDDEQAGRPAGGDDEADRRPAASPSPTASPTASPSPQETSREQTAASRRARRQQTAPTATEQQREVADQTERLEGAPPDLPPIASPSAKPGRVPEAVPGAIFRATVDRSATLTFGYEDATVPVLIDSAYFFRPSKEGTNALVFVPAGRDPLRIAGFAWPDNTERLLRGTAHVIDEPTGRGHVVLFAEDPNFRGFWRSLTKMFFNSFLFQPTF